MSNASNRSRIHLSPPDMTGLERSWLIEAFDSNWIAPAGPALNEFEARVRSIAGTEEALAVTSGTAALHLALVVSGIGAGDIVIVPSTTFVATANVVRYVGAVPHFVDADPRTANLSPTSLRQALNDLSLSGSRPAAVIAVDLYGSCANYTEIESICAEHEVPLIEDAAEAIGASHAGRPAGSFGSLGAFSFNGNKLVTTGGGGALVGPGELISKARHLASQARLPAAHFEHDTVGYAYRLSNLSAALGCAQLERLDLLIERTRTVHRRYVDSLSHLPGVQFLNPDREGRGNAWLTVLMTDPIFHRSTAHIVKELDRLGIEARPAWKPMHLQPAYRHFGRTGGREAESHFARGVCLPSGSSLSISDQDRVIDALASVLGPRDSSTVNLDALDLTAPTQQRQGNREPTR